MDNKHNFFEDFLELSVILTGFKKFRLFGTGQAVLYFDKINEIIGEEVVNQLLLTFSKIFNQTNRQDSEELQDLLKARIFCDTKLGPIARNMILLWYVGSWYQLPNNWRENYGQHPLDETFVLSPNSYTEGLLWPTIGAHPSGAKPQGFGSWGLKPVYE
jgi:hypothetical protein